MQSKWLLLWRLPKRQVTRKGVPAKLEDMSASEQAEVKQAVEQAKGASASIDLNRLANTMDGYSPKPNYIVKSALDMELIWCPPGSFIMGPGGADNEDSAHSVVLTQRILSWESMRLPKKSTKKLCVIIRANSKETNILSNKY